MSMVWLGTQFGSPDGLVVFLFIHLIKLVLPCSAVWSFEVVVWQTCLVKLDRNEYEVIYNQDASRLEATSRH